MAERGLGFTMVHDAATFYGPAIQIIIRFSSSPDGEGYNLYLAFFGFKLEASSRT
jgi:hypothetical protein